MVKVEAQIKLKDDDGFKIEINRSLYVDEQKYLKFLQGLFEICEVKGAPTFDEPKKKLRAIKVVMSNESTDLEISESVSS